MNENKKELINKIAAMLEENGVPEPKYDDYVFSEEFTKSLRWLPEENLQKMLKCDLSKCKTFGDAYQVFGRNGTLRFTPYIVNNGEENPSMCIRRDRFLHMFRGYHFQVSGTVDGIGDCGSGAYRTDFLTSASYYEKMLNKGLIAYMLWWAAMADAGFGFDNFRALFDEDKSVLEDFLNKSTAYWGCHFNYKWSDIEPYIVFSSGEIDKCSRKMYQLIDKCNKLGIYFAMGKKTIQVQVSDCKLLTLTIPDLNEGAGYDLTDEDDLDEYESQVYVLEENHYIEMLTVLALSLCRVKLSFINWYLLTGSGCPNLKPINSPDVVTVKSLNDIYKCEPDEF